MPPGPRSADAIGSSSTARTSVRGARSPSLRQQRIDAILCPPHALPATPHVKAFDLLAAASYSMLFNLLGLPAGVVSHDARSRRAKTPAGRSRAIRSLRQAAATDHGSVGLPVGVQVAGLPWREDVVLAVMAALEVGVAGKPDYPVQLRRSTAD